MTSSIFKQLLPTALCQLCRSPASNGFLCSNCQSELPYLSQEQCHRCALPLPSDTALCPECLASPPAFDSTLACFHYQPPVAQWIHNFKYQGNLGTGRLLLSELRQNIQTSEAPLPDLLVPIPMPRLRQWQRGFNQTQWLARQLSKSFNIPVCQALYAASTQQTQAGQPRKNRLKNKRHGFTIPMKKAVQLHGKYIALIDDVMTTGATLRNASKILKDSGACRVDLWIIARTAKQNGK